MAYDPTVGKWLQEDPESFGAGDANLSRYVGNDPTNATDPSGLNWAGWLDHMIGMGSGVWIKRKKGGWIDTSITTGAELRKILQDVIDDKDKITFLQLTTHGSSETLWLNHDKEHPELLFVTKDGSEIQDNNGNLTKLFKNALARDAEIVLNGCVTADLARKMSKILQTRRVTGEAWAGPRCPWTVGWSFGWFSNKSFVNGMDREPLQGGREMSAEEVKRWKALDESIEYEGPEDAQGKRVMTAESSARWLKESKAIRKEFDPEYDSDSK